MRFAKLTHKHLGSVPLIGESREYAARLLLSIRPGITEATFQHNLFAALLCCYESTMPTAAFYMSANRLFVASYGWASEETKATIHLWKLIASLQRYAQLDEVLENMTLETGEVTLFASDVKSGLQRHPPELRIVAGSFSCGETSPRKKPTVYLAGSSKPPLKKLRLADATLVLARQDALSECSIHIESGGKLSGARTAAVGDTEVALGHFTVGHDGARPSAEKIHFKECVVQYGQYLNCTFTRCVLWSVNGFRGCRAVGCVLPPEWTTDKENRVVRR
jgi:hypothetical protein